MVRSSPCVLASPHRIVCSHHQHHRILHVFFFLGVVFFAFNDHTVTAINAAKEDSKSEIEIHSQQFSFSHGAKPKVTVAIEGTEISGSQIHHAGSKIPQSSDSKPPSKPLPSKSQVKTPLKKPSGTTVKKTTAKMTPIRQTSALWPYELTDELTHQELMMILVIIVSTLGLVGLVGSATWYVVGWTWQTMRERNLLKTLFDRSATAKELEGLVQEHMQTMPLLLRPLATSHVRLMQFLEVVDHLLERTATVEFDEKSFVLDGLPSAPLTENDVSMKDEAVTFFHILSAIESLQCQGESLAVELTALVVPSHWEKYMDLTISVDELKKRMLALRKRHAEIQTLHHRVVETLERSHIEGQVVEHDKLVRLIAALRQTPNQNKTPAAETVQLASPLKLKNPKEPKDELGFLLRSFDELNQQRQVQTELEEAFTKLMTESRVSPLDVEVHVKKEETVEVKKEDKKKESGWRFFQSSTTTSSPAPAASTTTPTPSTVMTTSTTLTTRLDTKLTHTLERWVDRADEMEMTHLDEVKRAQYMLEEARRESFCLLNSSRDAMQSVESLKASLVSLGADPKAAVLTAAEIYSSRSNMLMLTTTLRSAFDEFRKADIIKMEDRRRRHAQKERDKRERIVAKFRMKQHLLVEKMELQRALEREQQERERERREKEEREAFIKQTKDDRKQFVWMITKLDVLIVLLVMAIVFFDSLTRQFSLLKPVCPTVSSSPSTLGFSSVLSSSWWPTTTLSLVQCRIEYAVKLGSVLLLGGFVFYIIAQLNLLTTALPGVIAAGLYHVRTEWMNMLFRLPVLLVLYGFNSLVLYLLNQSLSEDDPKQPSKVKRRAMLLYVAFPIASVFLSVVVSITIACDNPHECVSTAIDVTQKSFASLWVVARQAYHL